MLNSKLQRIVGIITLSIFVGVGLLYMTSVYADSYGLDKTAGAMGYSTNTSRSNIYAIIGVVVTAFLGLLGFVFFGLMLYSGLRWMLARGNQEFIEKAKSNLISAVIGLVIILGAYGITTFVFSRLGA